MPFLLIGGFIALLFNELILTISFAVAVSLVVAITIVPMLSSSPVQASDVDVILQGENEENLTQAGAQVLQALQERAKLATFRPDADPRQPEIQIRPDWERVSALGLSAQEIGATVQTAIEGSVPTQIQRGNRLVDVRVQLNKEAIHCSKYFPHALTQ